MRFAGTVRMTRSKRAAVPSAKVTSASEPESRTAVTGAPVRSSIPFASRCFSKRASTVA